MMFKHVTVTEIETQDLPNQQESFKGLFLALILQLGISIADSSRSKKMFRF